MNWKRSLQKRFGGVLREKIRLLSELHKECVERQGADSPAAKAFLAELRFLKMNRFISASLLGRLNFAPNPFRKSPASLVAAMLGLESEATVRRVEDRLEIGDFILPAPNEQVANDSEGALQDFVLPALLSRRCPDFAQTHERVCPGLAYEPAQGPYERGEVKLRAGGIVVDAGANLGYFSALASHFGCRALAFEPVPQAIEFVRRAAALHPGIDICPYALWDRETTLSLEVDESTLGVSTGVLSTAKFQNPKTIAVQATTLDAYAQSHGLEQVDFIKADVEGAERNLLQGARQVLGKCAPMLAICAYHRPDDPEVLPRIILDANPGYVVENRFGMIYAHVPK